MGELPFFAWYSVEDYDRLARYCLLCGRVEHDLQDPDWITSPKLSQRKVAFTLASTTRDTRRQIEDF